MITSAYIAEMARYNRWQNEIVFGLCDRLSDEGRRTDRSMFFGSIHATLDHIASGDIFLLHSLDEGRLAPFVPDRIVHERWEALKRARTVLDEAIEQLALDRDQGWLNGVVAFHSPAVRRHRRIPRGLFLMHMFNHQTHHRGQVTAELWKMGLDDGSTDLPHWPDILHRASGRSVSEKEIRE